MIAVAFGLRPMIVRQVTLLPDPDSPTMPSVWPFSTSKLTPSTALTTPSSVRKYVLEVVYLEKGHSGAVRISLILGSIHA